MNYLSKSEIHTHDNVFIEVIKNGKRVNLFQLNGFGLFLMSLFKKLNIKPLSVEGLRIPLLTGRWTKQLRFSNLITNAGKAAVASRLNGDGSEAVFTYIALGTGTTAAAATDTTLETELTTLGLSRAAGTVSRETTTVANDTAVVTHTWTATGSASVTESGVLNASSGGTLLNRKVFSAISLNNTDGLKITHKFAVS